VSYAPDQFIVGRCYSTRSICDHECIFEYAIIDRTAKTVWIVPARDGVYQPDSKPMARRVKRLSPRDCESIMPTGSYSMAPMLKANEPSAPAKMAPLKIGRGKEFSN
jgi:hypothetical protein